MTVNMYPEGTVADLVERLTAETLDWMEDVAAIRALQTATRRPDVVRGLVADHVRSGGRAAASHDLSVARQVADWNRKPRPLWPRAADEILENLRAYVQSIYDSGD